MEKYSLILLDTSGSIMEENLLNYIKALPSVARFCIPQSENQYNILLTPVDHDWREKELMQSNTEAQYLDIVRHLGAALSYRMGGSDTIHNIQKIIKYANDKNIEIENIFFLTDGYDNVGNRKTFEKELKLNPNLNLTMVVEKVLFDPLASYKLNDWPKSICMGDLKIQEDIVLEKEALAKTIAKPKAKKISAKAKKDVKSEIKI